MHPISCERGGAPIESRRWRLPILLCSVLFCLIPLLVPGTVRAGDPSAGMQAVHKLIAEGRAYDAQQQLKPLAESGNAAAQAMLGGFYHYGTVQAADFSRALLWYARAANQGDTDGMIGLATMYALGQGTVVDKAIAFKWLAIAAELERDPAAKKTIEGARDKLAADLSPSQSAAALAEARTFQPRPEK